jgi:hypothetical protein
LGCCGQSVWERLHRIGYQFQQQLWTPEEIDELKTLAPQCTLGEIGRRLGRTYAAVAGKVSELQVGVRYGNKIQRKLRRGSGLTKTVVQKFAAELRVFGGTARQFCIQRGLDLEILVQAFQKYDPGFWEEYVRQHSELSPLICPQCRQEFIPMTKKQRTCSRRCASLLRTDRKYFGGKRTYAVGLLEGVCQLCGREKSSLAAHHIYGKENDPENDYLVAVCNGCHQIIGHLGGRKDVEDPTFWENLIALALIRRLGHKRPQGFHVAVDIEELSKQDILDAEEQETVCK